MKVQTKRKHEVWVKKNLASNGNLWNITKLNIYWDLDSWNCLIYDLFGNFVGVNSLEGLVNEGFEKK